MKDFKFKRDDDWVVPLWGKLLVGMAVITLLSIFFILYIGLILMVFK